MTTERPFHHETILAEYPIPKVVEVRPIAGGLINPTFRVDTAEGSFALQSVHEEIPDSALQDMAVVTAHLASQGFLVPQLLHTSTDALFVRDKDGKRWRLYRWVPGEVYNSLQDGPVAYKAGRFLGRLHRALSALDYRPKGTIPHFHDTPYIASKLAALKNAVLEAMQAPMAMPKV